MYQGNKKFDREQLVFMAEVILGSALDRIESVMPDNITFKEYELHEDEINTAIDLVTATAGMGLAVLFAQLNDEGLGVADALSVINFHKIVADFVEERIDPNWPGLKPGDRYLPDCRPYAEKFVDKMFKEYLH